MYLSFQLANVTMSIFPEKTSLDRADVSVSLALTPRFFLNWNRGHLLFLRENFREVSPGGVLSLKDGWRGGFGSCSGPSLGGGRCEWETWWEISPPTHRPLLGGGFKHFWFLPLFGEDYHFD